MSAHVDPARAAGIASLAEGDPERRAAEAHAAECPPCERALRGATDLLAALDSLPQPAPPSAQALDRARRAVLAAWDAEPGLARGPALAAGAVPRGRLLLGASAVAAWLVVLVTARHHDSSGMAASLGGVVIAAVGALLTLSRDRLALAVLLGSSLAFALAVGAPGELAPGGLACAIDEAICAVVPLGALAWLAATRRATASPLTFAAAAAAGAVAGQAALAMTCADHGRPHLLFFHFGTVALAALVGAAASRMVRARTV